MKTRLAIAIPAYNRPKVLRENLEAMLPELRETGVPVFISDDSSDERTGQTIAEFSLLYPDTHYVRNQPSLGHDLNCLHTLELPDADYVWYLSDALRILPGGLKRVLALIESEGPAFLAVTAGTRKEINLSTGRYQDPIQIMEALAWHLTMTGATIYNHRFLEDMHTRYSHFLGTNFIQLGVLLQNLPSETEGFYWINENWVEGHPDKGESYWKKTPFKVFMKDWADFILGLQETYPIGAKRRTVRSHSLETDILEWRALKHLHLAGLLGFGEFWRYRPYWKLVTGVPSFLVAALALYPPSIRRFMRHSRKYILDFLSTH